MATIRSQMVLNDGISGVLHKITNALDVTLNAFEQVQRASGNAVDTEVISQARRQLAGARVDIQNMADGYRRAAQEEERLNENIRSGSNRQGQESRRRHWRRGRPAKAHRPV